MATPAPVELTLPCLDGTYLAAKAWGDYATASRMVLCIHGSLDNAASFNGLGIALAQSGSYVLAVDMFGHGLSPPAPGGIYGMEVWALGILDALVSTGWHKELVIVGHSLGTMIGTLVAGALATSRRSKGLKLTHVVLLDGSGLDPRSRGVDPSKSPRTFLERTQLVRRGLQRRSAEDKKVYSSLEAAVSQRMKKNVGGQPIKHSSAHDIVQRGTKVDPATGTCVFAHDVPQLMFLHSTALQASVESVDAYFRVLPPTLFIVAHSPTKGKPYFPGLWESAVARSRACAHGSIVTVPGYHHWHADHPDECAALISRFLEGEELEEKATYDAADPAQYDLDAAAKQLAVAEQIQPSSVSGKLPSKL